MMKLLAATFSVLVLLAPASAEDPSPWDLKRLFEPPAFEKVDEATKPRVDSIVYESIPFEAHPVRVFAYLGVPKGEAPAGGWPAVVLVHGGGGTAFDAWVAKWNAQGYAAISMDLEGHLPLPDPDGEKRNDRLAIENGGPARFGVFFDFASPLDEQWYPHAVAQVILAHSLIRSLPGVDPEKTGITGISWGGILTSTVIGLDDRLKFAIPVYGCGFLADSDGYMGKAIKDGAHTQLVNEHFDGAARFEHATLPTFWLNGTNDKHFAMPATQRSAEAVAGPATLRYDLRMAHGHGPGWSPPEIYAFADSVVAGGVPLATVHPIERTGDRLTAGVDASSPMKEAALLFTRDASPWPERTWESVTAVVTPGSVAADVPALATAAYFSVTDERGLRVTSPFIELPSREQAIEPTRGPDMRMPETCNGPRGR